MQQARFVVSGLKLRDDAEKIVRKITVYGGGVTTIVFKGDRGRIEEIVDLSKSGVTYATDIKGKTFELQFGLTEGGFVERIVFEYSVVGDEK